MMDSTSTGIHAAGAHIVKAQSAIGAAIAKRGPAVLQFSGGASSLACLYLVRPWWDRVIVLWANAGDEYPEARVQMDQVKALVPHFRELRGHAATEQAVAGWPVDMLPMRATWVGRSMRPDEHHRPMRLAGECCESNWWTPLGRFTQQTQLKVVIRGQRAQKAIRSPDFTDGTVYEGQLYALPIESWTSEQVMDYLASQHVEIPAQYAYGVSSLACLHCTAHLHEGAARVRYLRDHHPTAATEVVRRLRTIEQAQQHEAKSVRAALEIDTVSRAAKSSSGSGSQPEGR